MRRYLSFLCLFLVASTSALAQQVFHFSEGLLVPAGSRYGREAIYTDLLAFKLYNGTLQTPSLNAVFDVTAKGDTLRWRPAKADTAHRFRTVDWGNIPRVNNPGNPGRVDRGGSYLYLTYNSPKEQAALLNIKGNSSLFFNGVPHAGDPYYSGWLYIPVQLKKGLNELYVRGSNVTADLIFPDKTVLLKTDDPTLPHIVIGQDNSKLKGALVVVNTSSKVLNNYQLKAVVGSKQQVVVIPSVPAMSTRKVSFDFDGSDVTSKGMNECRVTLLDNSRTVDEANIKVESVNPGEQYSVTFTSNIDGSLQYYAVTPQTKDSVKEHNALFLSVHGAGVEAIGQARAYRSKSWGTLVAATNRRPRGFNWEDWGRLDALEVLQNATNTFNPDPQHIYLTGHSMGGHGTWFLGATYPDKWAAIGACSGYPTLKAYGSADGVIPDSSNDPIEQILLRASNQSDVPKLAFNYKPLGVYILHGDSDKVVPVMYARQMRKILGEFQSDFSYYEYPKGEHWFGDQSVDWKPMFDYFKWHTLPLDSTVEKVDFTTSNPGISAKYHWVKIVQQQHPLKYSRIVLDRSKVKKLVSGITENVRVLQIAMSDFKAGSSVDLNLDGQTLSYDVQANNDTIYLLKQSDKWAFGTNPGMLQKGPHRYGTLKDAFNYRMVFVYSTKGTEAENTWSMNKAKYDAETWYYRGNGAIDIVADKDFSADKYAGRGVIIYGNATTNSAWGQLLNDCPIQVQRNKVTAGNNTWNGDDLSAYFVWPSKKSPVTSVAVIAGSGIKGMNAANANQYFAGASGFPDFMIYKLDMLRDGSRGIQLSGFYDNEWKLGNGDSVSR